MTIFLCKANDIASGMCVGCGDWVHRVQQGGFPGPDGNAYCSEDCISDYQEWLAESHRQTHLRVRDLLCECSFCTAAGRPTVAERAEWAEYVAQYGEKR